jgi:hypothetical protein
MLGQI